MFSSAEENRFVPKITPPGSKSVAGRRFSLKLGHSNPQHQIKSNVCAKLRRNGPSLGGRAGAVIPMRHAAGVALYINVGSHCPSREVALPGKRLAGL
jgi:hypothetical protein